MYSPFRRHSADCPWARKGQNYTLCDCPIWAYTRIAGQPQRRSLGTRDWDRALRRIEILERGGESPPEFQTGHRLTSAVDSFIADCRARGAEDATLTKYARVLGNVSAFLGAGASLDRLSLDSLSAYRRTRKIALSTQGLEIRILRVFCAYCCAPGRKWLAENPAAQMRLPPARELVTQPFSASEVQRLLAACDTIGAGSCNDVPWIRKRARALVLTLLYSGLRISDVARLKRSALEADGHLVLRALKNGVPVKVLLHTDAADALARLPVRNPDYFFWTGHSRLDATTSTLRVVIRRLGQLAGIAAAPHRFRNTFAVELLSQGADIRTVQKLLGHRSVRTTEKKYAHFVAEHQKILDAAAAKLDFSPKGRPVLVRKV